jgi:hypothetical protein
VDLTTVENCFNGCTGLGSNTDGKDIKGDLFELNSSLTNFSGCFQNCSNLTGGDWQTIIDNAEAYFPTGLTTDDCFDGCTSLDDYATIPAAWK